MWSTTLIAVAAAAAAAQQQPAAPNEISAIATCRSLSDSAARLACYDQAAARLQQAIASKELTVLSRSDVRQTRRSLFGFALPKLPFLGASDEGAVSEITVKIASIREAGYRKWQFRLPDGAVWETTEPSNEGYMPDKGATVTIKQGILGNYFIAFQGMRTVRGRRIS